MYISKCIENKCIGLIYKSNGICNFCDKKYCIYCMV